ncbi:hypothetical protein AYO20_07026 [Fonsecaea nubica]|uniref:Uncharacterized protein n=1 Tax=Fonsecaea nubica TaxID=856822 RepID=A0A178CV32_9EURO|nr:hypothetical protein AYO20_07026 [Fonsecaea nubica]OAL33688.1 hypothetical protein AYO20_07026 [Fonsecaea nubica]
MPQMYNMPPYNMSPPINSFAHQSGYFGSAVPPPTAQQDTTTEYPLHQNETEAHTFYPVGRTTSHGSALSLPPPESPNALYMHGQPQHSQQPLPSIGMAMQPFPPTKTPVLGSRMQWTPVLDLFELTTPPEREKW